MDKQTYKKFKIGDRVSVKQTEEKEAYDCHEDVTPDMIGTIHAFPPKVRKIKGPLFDRGDYFAYIVFDKTYTHGVHTYPIRAGIDICNLRKVRSS